MHYPIIGIVTKYFNLDTYYGWSWMRISNNLRYALTKNGAVVTGILPQSETIEFQACDEHDDRVMNENEKSKFIAFLDTCDGVILQGGMNSCYYEEFTAQYCYEHDIPLLGICAGYNTIIRALGGTTRKLSDSDISLHEKPFDTYAHDVIVTDETSLYYSIVKEKKFKINSIHQYVGDVLPDTLSVVAKSDDGQIEVVEAKNKKFFMGIKYHPELLINLDKKQNDIFVAYINACKK